MEEEIFIDMTKVSFIGKHQYIIDGVLIPYSPSLTRGQLLKMRANFIKQQEKQNDR